MSKCFRTVKTKLGRPRRGAADNNVRAEITALSEKEKSDLVRVLQVRPAVLIKVTKKCAKNTALSIPYKSEHWVYCALRQISSNWAFNKTFNWTTRLAIQVGVVFEIMMYLLSTQSKRGIAASCCPKWSDQRYCIVTAPYLWCYNVKCAGLEYKRVPSLFPGGSKTNVELSAPVKWGKIELPNIRLKKCTNIELTGHLMQFLFADIWLLGNENALRYRSLSFLVHNNEFRINVCVVRPIKERNAFGKHRVEAVSSRVWTGAVI